MTATVVAAVAPDPSTVIATASPAPTVIANLTQSQTVLATFAPGAPSVTANAVPSTVVASFGPAGTIIDGHQTTVVVATAATGPAGSGLPPQWTADNLHGDVIATVDDPTKTPLTIAAAAGAISSQTAALLEFLNEIGEVLGYFADQSVKGANLLNLIAGPGKQMNLVTDTQYITMGADTITFGTIAQADVLGLWLNDGTRGASGLVQAISGAGPDSFADPPFTAWSSWAANNFSRGSFVVGETGICSFVPDDGLTGRVFIVFAPGSATQQNVAVTETGAVISNAHAEPPDALLNNSDHVSWLDDTPGSTSLRVKAKDSAGTVRTATIALS